MAQDIEPDRADRAPGPARRQSVRIVAIGVTLVIVAVAVWLFIQAGPGSAGKPAHVNPPDAAQSETAAKPDHATAAVRSEAAPVRN